MPENENLRDIITRLPRGDMEEFKKELAQLINKHSMENGSNTPDFILAEFLVHSLIYLDATFVSMSQIVVADLPEKTAAETGDKVIELYLDAVLKIMMLALKQRISYYGE